MPAAAKETVADARLIQGRAYLLVMKRTNHEILILAKSHYMNESAIEKEMEWLNSQLTVIESPGNFCTAHELVNRNSITQNSRKILKAIKCQELKPFRFLIGKN